MSLTLCPICSTVASEHIPSTPYWKCPNCAAWFQDPVPPKLWHGPHEPPPASMGDEEKAINDQLADWLFGRCLGGKPGPTLDVGAAYPWLARCLSLRGCEAWALDGEPIGLDRVHGIRGDFEKDEFAGEMFNKPRLVTFIHSFEHLYRPREAFRKLRDTVADDGRVFIRMPDHQTKGVERDMHPGMYKIHPFVHSLTSILQLCVETENCFEVEQYQRLEPGQADIILRPIQCRPQIAVGMIARDEERDLPRALASVDKVGAELLLTDTGSTDRTREIALWANASVETFVDASSQIDGRWYLQDFSLARNRVIDRAGDDGWYMWLDADDVLITPDAVRRAMYWPEKDCFALWIESGGSRWIQHRMWKLDKGVRFKGRCHEYPVLDGLQVGQLDDSLIVHHAEPTPGETSNQRNLRILTAEWEEDGPTPRTAFYIANTHRDAGRHKEAAEWYGKRLELGQKFRDEYLFALLYQARSYRACGREEDAIRSCHAGVEMAPDWAEFRMELANIAYSGERYHAAISQAMPCIDMPIPPTVLWRENGSYRDQPARLISWCHEHLKDSAAAIEWAKKARERIGKPDMEWDARLRRLETVGAPAILKAREPRICFRRPGAIGDVLMTLNLLPALREANPRKEIWYFTDPRLAADGALGWIIRAAGADQVMSANTFDEWSAKAERAVDLVGYPLVEGYPDRPMRQHLLHYFAEELGVVSGVELAHGERVLIEAGLPSLCLPRPARPGFCPSGDYATIQTHAGWSKYKQWDHKRWAEAVAQLGIPTVPIIETQGLTLHDAIAAFANARMHLGIDSFCNHLTNYRWWDGDQSHITAHVPGVILWGSTQASAAGYPHNVNISKGLPCQPCFRENPAISKMDRGPCINPPRSTYDDQTPHACMDQISVAEVVKAARKLWQATSG